MPPLARLVPTKAYIEVLYLNFVSVCVFGFLIVFVSLLVFVYFCESCIFVFVLWSHHLARLTKSMVHQFLDWYFPTLLRNEIKKVLRAVYTWPDPQGPTLKLCW